MKKMKNLLKMAALAAVLSTGFASCSSDDDANTTIITGSQAALDKACSDWKTARAYWENSEAFLFGAAGDFGIDPHIDSWPLDEDAFNTLMNSPAMIEALDREFRFKDKELAQKKEIELKKIEAQKQIAKSKNTGSATQK